MAEETKVIVQREETQAAQKAKETQAIADDAQRDLNEALPALVSMATLHGASYRMTEWTTRSLAIAKRLCDCCNIEIMILH